MTPKRPDTAAPKRRKAAAPKRSATEAPNPRKPAASKVSDRVKSGLMASLSTSKKRKKKPPGPPLRSEVNACSVLAVDGGETSGWSMWGYGVPVDFGECDLFTDEPRDILRRFVGTMPAPHVLVVERPFRMRFGNQLSLGVGCTTWCKLGEKAGLKSRTVRVYPGTWRSKVLPKKSDASRERDDVQSVEQDEAEKIVRDHWGDAPRATVGPESAPAILIGHWGSYAQQVFDVLPKVRPPKTIAVESIKLGRFAIRSKPAKRIERLTDGAAHMTGRWLVIDGQVAQRGDRITPEQLERAEVRLGYVATESSDQRLTWYEAARPHSCLVDYRATSGDIEAGWGIVADLVHASFPMGAAPLRRRSAATPKRPDAEVSKRRDAEASKRRDTATPQRRKRGKAA